MGAQRRAALVVVAVLFSSCPPAKSRCEGVACGAAAACDPASGACVPLPACSATSGCDAGTCIDSVCSACDSNVLCTAGFTTCDSTTGRCGTCRSSADCAAPFPVCAGARGCVECASDADCAAGVHCGSDQRCGSECRDDTECSGGTTCYLRRCVTRCPTDGGSCPAERPVCSIYGCEQCELSTDCAPAEGCYHGVCRVAPAGETCLTAIELPFSSGSALVQGAFLPYAFESTNDTSLTRDVFFRFEVTQESALNYDLTLDGLIPRGGAGVFTSCAGGDAVTGGSSVRDAFVVPGTYWIRIYEDSASSFTLHLWTTPASRVVGNHCLKPIALALDATGHAAITGDTRTVMPMSASTCTSKPAVPKLVYDVPVAVRSSVTARLHPLDPAFSPSLDMKNTCDGRLRQCASGLPGADRTAQMSPVEPGHVTVQVSELDGTSGPFELAVDVSPWALNSSCETATPLVFTAGVASARGLTFAEPGLCACYGLSCDNGKQLWRFSTVGLGERSLVVRLVPDGSTAAPALSVITRCAYSENSAVVGCEFSPLSGTRSVDLPRLPEGDYFIEVGESAGPFTLEATLSPPFPAPANDACAGAEVFDLGSGSASTVGDTRGAAIDTSPYCSVDPNPGEGRDVVYRIQASARGRASVTVVPDAPSFDPTLHLLGTCANGGTGDPCANDGGAGATESLSFDLQGTPRFLWVKGAHQTAGTFQLQGTFTPGPVNDTCAAATALTVPQTVSGTTVGAFHDFNQCDSLPSGPDVFYRFTWTASNNGTVNITLTPAGFDARLFVLTTSCTATSCTRLVNAAGVGQAESVALPVSRNITYYLGVDGDADGGTFTLSLQ